MTRLRSVLVGCLALLASVVTPAAADHHADAGYLVMTRAMNYPGTWESCELWGGVDWGGAGTLVLAGQEQGTFSFSIAGTAYDCALAGDEWGGATISGPGLYGELHYGRFATSVGIGGWVVIGGHRHRIAASVIGAVPTSFPPFSTDAWSGAIVLR